MPCSSERRAYCSTRVALDGCACNTVNQLSSPSTRSFLPISFQHTKPRLTLSRYSPIAIPIMIRLTRQPASVKLRGVQSESSCAVLTAQGIEKSASIVAADLIRPKGSLCTSSHHNCTASCPHYWGQQQLQHASAALLPLPLHPCPYSRR